MNNSFKKAERLKSKIVIESLFKQGSSLTSFPVKLIWMFVDTNALGIVQAAFVAPKKGFPRAVDRNRVKRLIREAYRLQKQQVYETLQQENKKIALMLIYVGKEIEPYKTLSPKINQLLIRLSDKIKNEIH